MCYGVFLFLMVGLFAWHTLLMYGWFLPQDGQCHIDLLLEEPSSLSWFNGVKSLFVSHTDCFHVQQRFLGVYLSLWGLMFGLLCLLDSVLVLLYGECFAGRMSVQIHKTFSRSLNKKGLMP